MRAPSPMQAQPIKDTPKSDKPERWATQSRAAERKEGGPNSKLKVMSDGHARPLTFFCVARADERYPRCTRDVGYCANRRTCWAAKDTMPTGCTRILRTVPSNLRPATTQATTSRQSHLQALQRAPADLECSDLAGGLARYRKGLQPVNRPFPVCQRPSRHPLAAAATVDHIPTLPSFVGCSKGPQYRHLCGRSGTASSRNLCIIHRRRRSIARNSSSLDFSAPPKLAPAHSSLVRIS
jgi:hypothetical protein